MKLRNKKTGEIVDVESIGHADSLKGKFGYQVTLSWKIDKHLDTCKTYNSLAELNEEWEDMPEEKWQDVLGFEELYQVSSFGNVRTIKKGEAEMSQQENRNGYMTVHLRDKGVERRVMVHRLVAEAFIPNPDELRDVNHKNGNKSDNRVENLEWVSHSDNMTHSFRELGKNVRHIVQLDLDNNFIERWNSIIEASEATGICKTDIGECCRGNRKHTKGYKWKYEEDYEEPKEYWYIDWKGDIHFRSKDSEWSGLGEESIGNYFETEEEAEKAVEKLKAWKRLKDIGFRFRKWESYEEISGLSFSGRHIVNSYTAIFDFNKPCRKYEIEDEVKDDLDILFGGEE